MANDLVAARLTRRELVIDAGLGAVGPARVENLRHPHSEPRRLIPRVPRGAVVREEQLPFRVVQSLLERRT